MGGNGGSEGLCLCEDDDDDVVVVVVVEWWFELQVQHRDRPTALFNPPFSSRTRVSLFTTFRFSVGQVSMFFPTPEGNFLAFNVGCPGHFLSKESQDLVGVDEHFRSYYVLGRIIEIQVKKEREEMRFEHEECGE